MTNLKQQYDVGTFLRSQFRHNPDIKVCGANIGPNWVLSATDGPHVGPMDLVVREDMNIQLIDENSRMMCLKHPVA